MIRTSTLKRANRIAAGASRKLRNRKRITRGMTNVPRGIYKFVRTLDSTNMTGGNTAASSGAAIQPNNNGFLSLTTSAVQGTQYMSWSPQFQIQDLPDYTEFTNLFDRYRLRGVSVSLTPIANVSAYQLSLAAATNQSLSGFLHMVRDYDDANAFPASAAGLALMHEYASHKTKRVTSSLRVRSKPKLALAVFQGAFTGYGQSRTIWVDCNTAAPYYGLKFLWEVFNPSATQFYINYKVECKYYIELKDLR